MDAAGLNNHRGSAVSLPLYFILVPFYFAIFLNKNLKKRNVNHKRDLQSTTDQNTKKDKHYCVKNQAEINIQAGTAFQLRGVPSLETLEIENDSKRLLWWAEMTFCTDHYCSRTKKAFN